MVYYFSSEYTAGLKLNGIYYGIITDTAKPINIENDGTFIEVLPLNAQEKPVCFLLDKNCLSNPPKLISITDLKGGYLIKFLKSYSSGEFGVINQQKYSDALITVYNDKGAKLSIDNANDFYLEKINFDFTQVEFYRVNGFSCGKTIIATVFIGKNNLINLYDIFSNPVRCIFSRAVDEFSFENGFTTTENLFDIAKHKITCEWDYNGEIIQEKSKTVLKSPNFSTNNLPQKLLPFAFTEELFVGGDIREYLTGNILDNAVKLRGFFGDFIGVFPPPPFKNTDCVGVVYSNGQNKYTAEYFYFEFFNGKICNIKKED